LAGAGDGRAVGVKRPIMRAKIDLSSAGVT
jgi:hypothetical protein